MQPDVIAPDLLAQVYFVLMHRSRGDMLPSEAMQRIADAAGIDVGHVAAAVAADAGHASGSSHDRSSEVVVVGGMREASGLEIARRLSRIHGTGVVIIDHGRSGQAHVRPHAALDIISPGSDILPFARERTEQARMQSREMLREAADYMKAKCDAEAVLDVDMPDRPRWQSSYGPAARPGRR